MTRLVRVTAGLALVVAVLVTVAARGRWPWDLAAMIGAFAAYGVVAALVAAGLFLLLVIRDGKGRRRGHVLALGVSLLVTVVLVAWQLPHWVPDRRPGDGPDLVVVAINARLGFADPVSVRDNAADADVVVLTELTAGLADRLAANGFGERFPYADSQDVLPARGAEGTRIYARFPLTPGRDLFAGSQHMNWLTRMTVPEVGTVTVVAVHPSRPHADRTHWLPEQQAMAAAIPRDPLTVVAGDFNATADHSSLVGLRAAGLVSAADLTGSGSLRTFPAHRRIPTVIRIDHILLAPGLTAVDTTALRVNRTDHLGVRAVVRRTATTG